MFRVVRKELWLIWDWDLVFYDGWVLGSYLAFIFLRVEKFVCLDLESIF